MFSRKQFFFHAAQRCFDLIKSCNSFFSLPDEDKIQESTELIPESLFLEAICLGMDPGTMNEEQLIHAVNSSRTDKNKR